MALMDRHMPWAVWKQTYDTYSTNDWEEDKRFVHKDMAEEYMASIAGWGTHTRLEGPEPEDPGAKEWQYLSKAEFDEKWVLAHGHAYAKDSDHGREILEQRDREERRRREYEEQMALKPIGRPKGKLP